MRDGLRASAEGRKEEWEEKVYADGKRCPGKKSGRVDDWGTGREKRWESTIMVKGYPLIPLLFFFCQEQAKKTLVFALWRLFAFFRKKT